MNDENETSRLFVGGLFSGATPEDLKSRFKGFGEVSDVEVRTKKDASGALFSTFAYLNLTANEGSTSKCIQLLNDTKWKGGHLKIQPAKQSFLQKLKDEREGKVESKVVPDTRQQAPQNVFAFNTKVKNQQWVPMKDKKVMPVLNIRAKDKRKVTRFNPLKYRSRFTKLSDDSADEVSAPINGLTWTLPEEASKPEPTKLVNVVQNGLDKQIQKRVRAKKPVVNDSDRGDDSSDFDDFDYDDLKSNSRSFENSSPNVEISKTTNVVVENKAAFSDELEVVEAQMGRGLSKRHVSRKRTRFDSSGNESDIDYNQQYHLRHTKISKAILPPTKSIKLPVTNHTKKDHKETKKAESDSDYDNGVLPTLSKPRVNSLCNDSGSESDVPDLDTWLSKPVQSKNRTKTESPAASRTKLSKREANPASYVGNINLLSKNKKADMKNKKKDVAAKTISSKVAVFPKQMLEKQLNFVTSEFSSGLTDATGVRKVLKTNSEVGDEREEDTDDEDILDAVTSKNWKLVKQFENSAKNTIVKGKHVGKKERNQNNLATLKPSVKTVKECAPAEKTSKSKLPANIPQLRAAEEVKSSIRSTEERQEADNRKRLEAMKEKERQNKKQHSLISAALASVDKGSNANSNKIVFDSSDEEPTKAQEGTISDDSDNQIPASNDKALSVPKENEKRSLFGDDDSSEDEQDLKSQRKYDENQLFGSKEHFEGKAGKKLMALQSRIGTADNRFKIDPRFADDASSDSEGNDVEEKTETVSEKKKTLDILQSVVGHSLKQRTNKPVFKDMAAMRYDPTLVEHKQFEIVVEKPEKKKKKKQKTVEEPVIAPLPEVSKDTYFDVSESLGSAFRAGTEAKAEEAEADELSDNKEQPFSLLSMFGDAPSDAKKSKQDGVVEKKQKVVFPWQTKDDEDSSSEDERRETHNTGSDVKDSSAGFSSNASLFKEAPKSFFIGQRNSKHRNEGDASCSDIPTLQEGLEFFNIDKNKELKNWSKTRDAVKASYHTISRRTQKSLDLHHQHGSGKRRSYKKKQGRPMKWKQN